MDAAPREAALGAVLVVHGSEDIGIGPEVAELEEYAIGTAHAHEKVVNEGRARCDLGQAQGAAV